MMVRYASRLGTVMVAVLMASTAFAQLAGSLRGIINDESGGVLPGATVVLTNEGTKAARQVVSDSKGSYYFAAVQPGVYTVRIEMQGFKKVEQKGVRVSPGDARGLDLTLAVGAQTETVEVTAQRELIQTETGAREGLIRTEQIDNLSIISRSPMELLRILPGVVTTQDSLESVSNGGGANQTNGYSVNGIRGSNNVVTLDGSRMIDIGANNGLIIAPNVDFVSEVKVQSSNYAAEFGSGGVQLNAITKGGSSEFHGTVYDYLRHYKLAANDRSNSIAGIDKPKSKYQYPGANLSGPIIIPGTGFNKNRDKAFFFFGFEMWRQKVDTGSSFAVVPTLGQRAGNFNDYQGGQNLNQPTRVNIPSGFPGAGTPAPGNNLAPYIDPFGRALINQYPAPNYVDPNNRYNYVYSALQEQNTTQFTLRLDYNFSDSTKAYVRLAQDDGTVQNKRGLWWNSSNYELPTPISNTQFGRSASLNVTSVLSPTTTNELVFTFSKLKLDNRHEDPSKISLSALGFPNFQGYFGAQSEFTPNVFSWGQGLGNLWDPADQENVFAYNSSLQLSNNFTKVLNTHALKVGFSLERQVKNQNFQNDARPRIILGGGWIPGTTTSDFGDLLVGRPARIDSGTALSAGNWQAYNLDGYVQDSWKVKKNLTLEYGVRVSKWTNNSETNDLGAVFIPENYNPSLPTFLDAGKTRLNGVSYVANGDVPQQLIDSRPIGVMPRVNFAWDISGNGDTVLRGGAGVFFNRNMGNAEYDILRIAPNGYYVESLDANSLASLGPNGLTYDNAKNANPLSRIGRINVDTVNPNSVHFPRTYTTSLSLARRIPWQQVLEVSYVGTFGRNLLNRRQDNIIEPGELFQGRVGNSDLSNPLHRVALNNEVRQQFRRYPTMGDIHYWEFEGDSHYHSLQATLSRQTGRRLQYFVAYTFGKVIGTSVANGEYDDIDPFDPDTRSKGILSYDRTHVLNVSYNYSFPDLTSKGGVLGAIANGWQLSGISTYASGVPISVGFAGDIVSEGVRQAWWGTPNNVGFRVQNDNARDSSIMPTFSCDPRGVGGASAGEKILDVSCVGIPNLGESGAFTTPFYIRFPARMNHDVTLFKNFPIGKGSKKLQFRAGVFNMLNQAVPSINGGQDVDMALQTTCNVRVNGVPNGTGGTSDNVCDPRGGFSLTQNSISNFSKILLQRGHRVIEFAVKFYF